MPHLSDDTLLDLVAGRLSTPQRQPLEAHLSECEQCRRRFERVGSMWEKLGSWQVSSETHDLTERVLEQAEHAEESASRSEQQGRMWFRAAAVWIIAAGIGVLGGRALTIGPGGAPTADSAADALRLDDFQNGSPALMAEQIVGFQTDPTTKSTETPK